MTSPSKPALRAASTARRPANEAPTTTKRSTLTVLPGPATASALDTQRFGRASGDGLLDGLQLVVGDALPVQDERTVVVDLEEFRCHRLADAQPRALGEINDDLHVPLLNGSESPPLTRAEFNRGHSTADDNLINIKILDARCQGRGDASTSSMKSPIKGF